MHEINVWLNLNSDFYIGVDLYEKYGSNSFLKKLLRSGGATPYNILKLETELKRLSPALEVKPDVLKPLPNREKLADIPTQPDTIKSHPENHVKYLQLVEYKKNLYRQLERNMMELDVSEKEIILHMTAKTILALHNKIQDIYKLLDFFDEKGQFPAKKEVISRSPPEEIQLLRVSTSKAKQRLESGKCRDVQQTKTLIEQNNKRILELGGKVNI